MASVIEILPVNVNVSLSLSSARFLSLSVGRLSFLISINLQQASLKQCIF